VSGKLGPDGLTDLPFLLEQGCEVGILKPENTEVCVIGEVVLTTPHSIKILRIQPIDIRMGIPRIARPSVYITSIHLPEIGHDINVMLGDVRRHVLVHDFWLKD
jgi:hypothetical protein